MKSFFKTVLAVIVGLTSLIIIPVIIISAISKVSSLFENNDIKEKSILEIDFKIPILESNNDIKINLTSLKPVDNILFYDIIKAVEKAKSDDNIKGISLKLNGITTDYAQSQSLRNKLIEFKKSGKFIYAYGNNVTQKDYYLATAADSIFVFPLSNIKLTGMSAEVIFYKKLYEKIGVEYEIIKHGKYKSAVEPYFLDKMSPESKEQTQILIDDIWNNISAEIAKSRGLNLDHLNKLTDSLSAFNSNSALSNKLIDGIKYENEYNKLLGIETDINKAYDKNILISTTAYVSSLEKGFNKNQIAIIYASGTITHGKGRKGIQDQSIIKQIREVKDNDNVKSVVLRINSPGGDAAASERILHELKLLKKEKPLIVSFGGVAASGGYYIAGAADTILASPNTITGSIGVFGALPNFKKMSEKIGITTDVTKTNYNSNMYSLLTGTSPKLKSVIRENIENVYDLFLENVAQNRNVSKEEIDSLGQGRVWSGIKAKENGLVDLLGDINLAVNLAANKVNLNKYDILQLPRKRSDIEMMMEKFRIKTEMNLESIISEKLGPELYNSYKEIDYMKNNGAVHLKMPYSIELK